MLVFKVVLVHIHINFNFVQCCRHYTILPLLRAMAVL